VLVPYFRAERARLLLPATQWCVAIFDCWTLHKMDWFLQLLKSHNIAPVFVPGGTTGDNQPQDLSVNRPFKATARAQFEAWLASLSDAELARAGSLPALKANVLSWISAGVDHVRAHSDKMVLAGWRRAGILPRCFDASFQERAKFVVLNASAASAVPLPGEYTQQDNLQRLRALVIPASELVVEEEEIDSGVVAAHGPVPPGPAHLPSLPEMPSAAAAAAVVVANEADDDEECRQLLPFCFSHLVLLLFFFFLFEVLPGSVFFFFLTQLTLTSLARTTMCSPALVVSIVPTNGMETATCWTTRTVTTRPPMRQLKRSPRWRCERNEKKC
jgi:hypothetical protein